MKWKEKVKQLKTEVYVLFLALKDRRTPWYAKALAVVVVAYALSPVDLIPDFIPVLGYLDDLILVPAGIYLVFKMIPDEILEEHRRKARTGTIDSRTKWIAAAVVILIWLLIVYLIIKAIWL
jgi:uncharacterized membrane protein YkvA (DUF1232 family)